MRGRDAAAVQSCWKSRLTDSLHGMQSCCHATTAVSGEAHARPHCSTPHRRHCPPFPALLQPCCARWPPWIAPCASGAARLPFESATGSGSCRRWLRSWALRRWWRRQRSRRVSLLSNKLKKLLGPVCPSAGLFEEGSQCPGWM